MARKVLKSVKPTAAVKSIKAATARTVRNVQADSSPLVEKGREIWLASIGAAAIVRKKGESLLGGLNGEAKQLRKQANKLVNNFTGDINEQAQGVLAQVKSATAANLNWAADKAEGTMGKVLNRIGVPTKADVSELSRRVDALHKQIKAMKKAA